jgi:hypothetical protein
MAAYAHADRQRRSTVGGRSSMPAMAARYRLAGGRISGTMVWVL